VYAGIKHTKQCRQYYRNSKTLMVQVRGTVTLHDKFTEATYPEWKFGHVLTTPNPPTMWLLPPGRVNMRHGRKGVR